MHQKKISLEKLQGSKALSIRIFLGGGDKFYPLVCLKHTNLATYTKALKHFFMIFFAGKGKVNKFPFKIDGVKAKRLSVHFKLFFLTVYCFSTTWTLSTKPSSLFIFFMFK